MKTSNNMVKNVSENGTGPSLINFLDRRSSLGWVKGKENADKWVVHFFEKAQTSFSIFRQAP